MVQHDLHSKWKTKLREKSEQEFKAVFRFQTHQLIEDHGYMEFVQRMAILIVFFEIILGER